MHRQHPIGKILCNNYRTMVAMILISTIPTGILGYLLQNLVDRWSSSLPVTGLGLLITAVLLLVVDNWQLGNKLPKHITVPQALAIGVCQGISVIPGISRSGITITAGFMRFSPRFRHSIFLSCIDSGNPGCYDS